MKNDPRVSIFYWRLSPFHYIMRVTGKDGGERMATVRQEEIGPITEALRRTYPEAECALDFRDPFQLLVAVVLSAQTTDKSVNQVTPALFSRYPDPSALADADPCDVEGILRRIGLYRTKARNIIALSRALMAIHGGRVPADYKELTGLPGVGRKTANVVLAVGFHVPRIAVDTHVFRLANRIGLTDAKDVLRTEEQLMERFPEEDWILLHHALIWHGRRVCDARRPACEGCALRPWCRRNGLPPLSGSRNDGPAVPKTILRARGLELRPGAPAIALAVAGEDRDVLFEELDRALAEQPDLVEWRADSYGPSLPDDLPDLLDGLRAAVRDLPVLFTYRGVAEGGSGRLRGPAYRSLLLAAVRSGAIDLIDIEQSRGKGTVRELTADAKKAGVVSVVSRHDFEGTPGAEEMEEILRQMYAAGDLPKLAVTAHRKSDARRLLAAAEAAVRKAGGRPLIAIAMGEAGAATRTAVGGCGTCLTFAAGATAAAPGQIPIRQLRRILNQGAANTAQEIDKAEAEGSAK